MGTEEAVWDAKTLLEAVSIALPNISRFLRNDLKTESLSSHAERARLRYDTLMLKLETAGGGGSGTTTEDPSRDIDPAPASSHGIIRRRHTTPDFPIFFSQHRESADYDYLPSSSPSPVPDVTHSGFVLLKDQLRNRWHRHWCRLDGLDQRFRVMDEGEGHRMVQNHVIAGAELLSGAEINSRYEKDFVVVLSLPSDREQTGEEVIFAAYDAQEFVKWRDSLGAIVYPNRARGRPPHRATVHTMPTMDQRESFLSSITSSSGYVSPVHTTKPSDDLSRRPKKDPLPSLPIEERTKDSDTETIYEEIDVFQEMVDQHLKKADMLLEPLRGNKKWKTSLPSFSGFITRLKRNSIRHTSTPPTLVPRPAVNQEEDEYRGYLLKQSSADASLWKKKWCVLRHCIFAYYDTPDDIEGNSVVLLGFNVESVQDRRAYVFKLSSDTSKELYFAADTEEDFLEWWSRLDSATKAYDQEMDDDFACDWMNDRNFELNSSFSTTASNMSADSKRLTMDSGVHESPSAMFAAAGGDGIYDVPRSSLAPFGGKIFPSQHHQHHQHQEGLYDIPSNIPLFGHEDDYDYPPDARDMREFSTGTTDSNIQSLESLMSKSSSGSDEQGKRLPSGRAPVPSSSARPGDEGRGGDRSRVVFTPGELEEMLPGNGGENPYSEVKRKWSGEPQLDFSSCAVRGCLFKRDRYQWNKAFCAVRGSYFELYKNDSLITKIFLPGAEVQKDPDSRRPWSFKLRHSKKDEVMHLAADTEGEYQRWMSTLTNASTINEDMYRSRQNSATPTTDGGKDRRASSKSKRKFSDIKLKFRSKSRKENSSNSNLQNLSTMQSNESLGGRRSNQSAGGEDQSLMRRSLSLTAVTTSTQVVGSSSQTRKVYSSLVQRYMRGWLQVQLTKVKDQEWRRAYCVLENLKFFCFTDEGCDELISSVPLKGSRVSRAGHECSQDLVFKIWQLSTTRVIYLLADSQEEFTRWMEVGTNGADYVLPDATADSSQSLHRAPSFYYFPPDFDYPDTDSMSLSLDGLSSIYSSRDSLQSSATTAQQGLVHYKGLLKKKKNDSGTWMDRHCIVKDDRLLLYYTPSDLTPLSSLVLTGATLEVLHDKVSSQGYDAFTIRPVEGLQQKMMTFASPSQNDLWMCLAAIYEASQQTVKMSNQDLTKLQLAIKDQRQPGSGKSPRKLHREPQLTVPFSKLAGLLHSGMVNVKMDKEPWTKYWCAVTDLYFHTYQTPSSQVAVQVTHLPGSRIQLVGSASRGYMILLEQTSHAPMFIASDDKQDFGRWFAALEAGIQRRAPEGGEITRGDEQKESRRRRKAPKTVGDSRKDAIMKQFEKNVKKTRKVARKADQNLKQQHMTLMYIRRELDKHLLRLKERTDKGDEHAVMAAESLATKAIQIEQVLPYLEKCIKVNRQAELQTIAVLQKGREEALRDQVHPETTATGGDDPGNIDESTSGCDQTDSRDDLNATLTSAVPVPVPGGYHDNSAPLSSTPLVHTPKGMDRTPPKPMKLQRTHTTESSTSQNSEIFVPKAGVTSPQDFVRQAWHRPGSARSQASDGDCATPIATSPMVLAPRRFKRSQSSGQPNKVNQNGGSDSDGPVLPSRPGSASSNRVHMAKLMLQGTPGTEL